jgi:hypothetical protein
MAKSTEGPKHVLRPLKGGYNVQPTVKPGSVKPDIKSSINAGGNNQKLKLFKRGKAISGAPIIIGTNQFPNPPIKTGITIKKIITKACNVTITL